jgi:hypothetical protein
MCDPLVGGLIAGAASLASGAMEAQQQQNLADAQNQANDQWVAYQNQVRRETQATEEAAHQKAEAARQETLQKISPQNQTQEQITEAQRLNTLYSNPSGGTPSSDPNYAQSQLLSGEKTGPTNSMSGITSQINQATSAARGRIAALATAGSYGGSFGGLGTQVPIDLAQGGNAINLQDDIRRGNIATDAIRRQVEPLKYAAGPGAGMFGSVAKALGGIAGTGLGSSASSAWSGGGNLGPGGGAYLSDVASGGGWNQAPGAWG